MKLTDRQAEYLRRAINCDPTGVGRISVNYHGKYTIAGRVVDGRVVSGLQSKMLLEWNGSYDWIVNADARAALAEHERKEG